MFYEVSGNLISYFGEEKYKFLLSTVGETVSLFEKIFGKEKLNKYGLFIDNSTEGSGHTPIITPILNKYLIIKLKVNHDSDKAQIIYQFAHELCHLVFYNEYGLNKNKANDEEESICTAVSLLAINVLSNNDFKRYLEHTGKLKEAKYRNGLEVLLETKLNWDEIKEKIFSLYKD